MKHNQQFSLVLALFIYLFGIEILSAKVTHEKPSLVRVQLKHMKSIRDQLKEVDSNAAIFRYKYNYDGPIPEPLSNYLDV